MAHNEQVGRAGRPRAAGGLRLEPGDGGGLERRLPGGRSIVFQPVTVTWFGLDAGYDVTVQLEADHEKGRPVVREWTVRATDGGGDVTSATLKRLGLPALRAEALARSTTIVEPGRPRRPSTNRKQLPTDLTEMFEDQLDPRQAGDVSREMLTGRAGRAATGSDLASLKAGRPSRKSSKYDDETLRRVAEARASAPAGQGTASVRAALELLGLEVDGDAVRQVVRKARTKVDPATGATFLPAAGRSSSGKGWNTRP